MALRNNTEFSARLDGNLELNLVATYEAATVGEKKD